MWSGALMMTTIRCATAAVLAVLLGAAGLPAWLGYADYVLLPALGICLAITVYAVTRQRRLQAATRERR